MSKPKIELELPELNAHVSIVGRDITDGGPRDYYKKSRVFVFGIESLPELVIEDVTLPAPTLKGEDKDVDKAYAKRNRLYGQKTKEVAEAVTRVLLAGEFIRGDVNAKIRFSAHAGCSCPCSPGTIVDDTFRADKIGPVDVFITLK